MFFDEFSYIESLLCKPKLLNKERSIKNLIMIARYYMDCGKDITFINNELEKIIINAYSGMNKDFIDITKNKAIECAKSRDSLTKNNIEFSIEELNYIKNFNNIDLEKIIFIMMCIYKSNNLSSFSVSKRFLSLEAKVNKNMDNMYKLFNILESNNIFNSTIYQGNLYYKAGNVIKNMQNINESYLYIGSKKNIIYYYLQYRDKSMSFIKCKSCECIDIKTGKTQYYCKECAVKIDKEKAQKRMKNIRMFDS